MAIVYESIASAAFASFDGAAKTVTITKPSGLAAGDTMLGVVGWNGLSTSDVDTPSGWTLVTGAGADSGTTTVAYRLQIYAKVANSSDAAASNFSFNCNGGANGAANQSGGGFLFRFSGSYVPTIFDSDTGTGTSITYTGGVTPTVADNILVMAAFGHTVDSSVSSYAIVTNNPTWTERGDINGTTATLAVATGPRAEITATGDYSLTFANSSTTAASLICLQSQQNVTASPSVIAVTASIQAPSITGGANVTPSVITASASIQTPTISTAAPDWLNTDKSHTSPTITNISKS